MMMIADADDDDDDGSHSQSVRRELQYYSTSPARQVTKPRYIGGIHTYWVYKILLYAGGEQNGRFLYLKKMD